MIAQPENWPHIQIKQTNLNKNKLSPKHNWKSQLTKAPGTCLTQYHPRRNSGWCFVWQRFRMGNSSAPENCTDLPPIGDCLPEPAVTEESRTPNTAEWAGLHGVFLNSQGNSSPCMEKPELRNWLSQVRSCFHFPNLELQGYLWATDLKKYIRTKAVFHPTSLFLLLNQRTSWSWQCLCTLSKGVPFSHEWASVVLRSQSSGSVSLTSKSFVRLYF